MNQTKVNLDPVFQRQEFDTAIEAMRAFQPQLKAIIASTDINRLQRETYSKRKGYPRELYQEVCDLFAYALFFPDEQVSAFFKALGFTDEDLELMVPLEQIVGIIDNIAAHAPHCQKHFALWCIQGYLKMKVAQ